jgi:hypothetical protein
VIPGAWVLDLETGKSIEVPRPVSGAVLQVAWLMPDGMVASVAAPRDQGDPVVGVLNPATLRWEAAHAVRGVSPAIQGWDLAGRLLVVGGVTYAQPAGSGCPSPWYETRVSAIDPRLGTQASLPPLPSASRPDLVLTLRSGEIVAVPQNWGIPDVRIQILGP